MHHETTTGMLNPLRELLQLCQKYEVDSIVDAMSSYAGLPIDMSELPIDYLISSSNKCIQGMAGTSFVIANKEKLIKMPTRVSKPSIELAAISGKKEASRAELKKLLRT